MERTVAWVRGQFDTRTIVLMPIAIAINIVLGQTVAAALKIPVYFDSIGTIFVGVVAGPIAGLLTGVLSNLIWTYILPAPFRSDFAAPFFVVAAEIGLLAGVFGWFGWFRSRPNTPWPRLLAGGLVVAGIALIVFVYGFIPFYGGGATLTFFGDATDVSPIFTVLGAVVAVLLVLAIVALFVLLFVRRDLGVVYVVLAGAIVGVVSAIIAAPIAAIVFGGVTGSGTDLLVAAFQQAGSDLQTAVLQQGLLSDPIDKTLTFFIVFLLLQALPRRVVARFPQGERAIGLAGDRA
jgi:hypothetical protein